MRGTFAFDDEDLPGFVPQCIQADRDGEYCAHGHDLPSGRLLTAKGCEPGTLGIQRWGR